jgi:ParB family chromosome partitioning protein
MSDIEDGKRRGLGRGLSALFGEEAALTDAAAGAVQRAPIGRLQPGPYQPRRRFDDESLAALAESIREKGILEPILVREHPEQPGNYQIIAGERRWRAAQAARLHEVPVLVQAIDDREALEIALVENIHREDLSPLEEAEAYQRLIEEFRHTQEALARAIGKSRSHVANTLRLLGLPDAVKRLIHDGLLSAGHARALVTAENADMLAEEIVAKGLNVRQTEQLVRRAKPATTGRPRGRPPKKSKDPNTVALERDLSAMLGMRTSIEERASGGTLSIHYETLEQLDDLLQRLSDSGDS